MQPPLSCNSSAASEDGQARMEAGFKFASFFSSNFDSKLQARLSELRGLTFSTSSALLAGPPRSGKTTLLFQYAHNHLLENQHDTALFITRRHRLEGSPPLLPQGVTKTSAAFERLNLRYLDNDHELRKYFVCIHLLRDPPSLIIVDDFAEFFSVRRVDHGGPPRSREQAFVKTLALLHDAACFLRQSKRKPCTILVSDTNVGETPRNLYLYQRWIPLLINIKASDGNTFTASASDTASGVDVRASYSLTSASLTLEEIEGKQTTEQEAREGAPFNPTQSLRS